MARPMFKSNDAPWRMVSEMIDIDKIKQVAGLLGWRLDTLTAQNWRVRIFNPETRAEFYITKHAGDKMARIHALRVKINVSLSRTAASLAADIKSRFMPKFLAEWRELQAEKAKRQAEREAEAVEQAIFERVGMRKYYSHRDAYGFSDIDVTISGSRDRWQLTTRHGLNAEQVLKIRSFIQSITE
jgi:hypothetical protein